MSVVLCEDVTEGKPGRLRRADNGSLRGLEWPVGLKDVSLDNAQANWRETSATCFKDLSESQKCDEVPLRS